MSMLRLAQGSFRGLRNSKNSGRWISTARPTVHSSRQALRRGAVLALCAATSVAVYTQTRKPILLEALPLVDKSSSSSGSTRTDPATGVEFPETLSVASRVRLPPFQLIGLGVRTVSFLRMKVYSVAFYADLSNPSLKIPENLTPEEKIEYIVSNTACLIRIIPVRNTSFPHLRDGLMRTLQAHMSSQLKEGSITAEVAEAAQSPLRKFKSIFPSTTFAKGSPLDMILLPPPKNPADQRMLVVRDLGSVESNWVAEQFILAYFKGDGLSPPMKQSTLEYLSKPSSA